MQKGILKTFNAHTWVFSVKAISETYKICEKYFRTGVYLRKKVIFAKRIGYCYINI